MTNFLKSIGFIHLLVAIAMLPLQTMLGPSFQILVAPYIAYLVWARNPLYLPALFVLIAPGSTLSIFALLITLVLTVLYIPKFRTMRLGWLVLLALLPLPVFIYMTGVRLFGMGMGIVEILKPLGFYLGLFPFFYGILIAPKIDRRALEGILLTFLILPLLKFMPLVEFSIRAYWFSFPLFFAFAGAKIFLSKRLKVPFQWSVLSILFLLFAISFLGIKFTLIFAAFLALFALFTAVKGYEWLLNLFAKPKLVILSVALVAVIVSIGSNYSTRNTQLYNVQESINYFDPESFWEGLKFKTFGDRAPIWAGGWALIQEEKMIWPPYKAPSYSFLNYKGSEVEDIEFGIHNIGLELMRNYGMVVGGVITLTYILMLIIGPGRFLRNRVNSPYLLLLAATCLGSGIVGGLVGQYVLMIAFSFILLSLSGMLFGQTLMQDMNEGPHA